MICSVWSMFGKSTIRGSHCRCLCQIFLRLSSNFKIFASTYYYIGNTTLFPLYFLYIEVCFKIGGPYIFTILYKHKMRYKSVSIDEITIFNTPLIYLQLLSYVLKDLFFWFLSIVRENLIKISMISVLALVIYSVQYFKSIYTFIIFMLYWLILGVASSIGLGSGLHTFILYLGPHIAKVALTASTCGTVPQMIPSRWDFQSFAECHSQGNIAGIIDIVSAVQIQSILWGLGTAIGELPPYFVTKKAAEARVELRNRTLQAEKIAINFGEEQQKLINVQKEGHHLSNEEIQEILVLKKKDSLTFIQRIKVFLYNNLQKYGFWAVLVFASIPNPLFDLAGIACGHFRIPFKTFFSATVIGKAFIKVNFQVLFIVLIFRKESMTYILSFLSQISPKISQFAKKLIQQQTKSLSQGAQVQKASNIGLLWNSMIGLMMGYFLKSIVDAYVKQKAIQLKQ